jgi:hypothetical protein
MLAKNAFVLLAQKSLSLAGPKKPQSSWLKKKPQSSWGGKAFLLSHIEAPAQGGKAGSGEPLKS